MAIASLPEKKEPSAPRENLKHNTVVNDVPDTTTPWLDTVSTSTAVDGYMPVDGMPWVGVYYQRLRATEDTSDALDTLISSPYQQYARINNYELLLDSELTTTTDPVSKTTSATINVTIADTIIPNRGDVFLADIGDGRIGLFVMTETQRPTLYNRTIYLGEMVLQHIIDNTDNSALIDLDSKVTIDYHYNHDYLSLGKSPILSTDELTQYQERANTATFLRKQYLNEFYHRPVGSIALCQGDIKIYDANVVSFISKTFKDLPNNINQYTVTDVAVTTIYDLLINNQPKEYKQHIEHNIRYMEAMTGMDLMYRYGLMHTTVTHLAIDDALTISYDYGHSVKSKALKLSNIISASAVDVPTPLITSVVPPLPDVLMSDKYVLSTNWYDDTGTTSVLESMVDDFLLRRPLDPRKLKVVTDACNYMDIVSKFYLLPIIIFILTYSK